MADGPKKTAVIDMDDKGYQSGARRVKSSTDDIKSSWRDLKSGASATRGGIMGVGDALMNLSGPQAAAVAGIAAVGAALVKSAQAAIAWESVGANIAKTAGAATDVDALSQSLITMSTEIPMAAAGLGEIAAIAGQLGVDGTENVLAFTETIAQASVAFDMLPEAAADALATMVNLFEGGDVTKAGNLASAVNTIANSMAASEPDIMAAMSEMAGLGAQYGMTGAEAAALSGKLIALGMNGSKAGTLTNSLMTQLTDPSKWGVAGEMLGMTSEAFGSLITSDIDEGLLQIAEHLASIGDGAERAQAISDLGLGIEAGKPLTKMLQDVEGIREAMELANQAYEENVSLSEEAGAKFGTTASKIQLIKNDITAIAIDLGDWIINSTAFQTSIDTIHSTLKSIAEIDWTGMFGDITSDAKEFGGLLKKGIFEGDWSGWTISDEEADLIAARQAGEITKEEYLAGLEGLGEEISEEGKAALEEISDEAPDAGEKTGEDFAKAMADAITRNKAGVSYAVAMALSGDADYADFMPSADSPEWKEAAENAATTWNDIFFEYAYQPQKTGSGKYTFKVGEYTFETSRQALIDKYGYGKYGERVDYSAGVDWAYLARFYKEKAQEEAIAAFGAEGVDLGEMPVSAQAEWIDNPLMNLVEETIEEISSIPFVLDMDLAMGEVGESAAGALAGSMITSLEAADLVGQMEQLMMSDPSGFHEAGGYYGLVWLENFEAMLADYEADVAAGVDEKSLAESRQTILDFLESAPFPISVEVDEITIPPLVIDWPTEMKSIAEQGADVFSDNFIDTIEAKNMVDLLTDAMLADLATFEEMGGSAALSWWEGVLDLLEQREALIKANADTSEIDDQIRTAIEEGSPYVVNVDARITGILNLPDIQTALEVETGGFSMADLLKMDPDELSKYVDDYKKFGKSVVLPAVIEDLTNIQEARDEGWGIVYSEERNAWVTIEELEREGIENLMSMYDALGPELFAEKATLLEAFSLLPEETAYTRENMDWLIDKILGITDAYNNLADALDSTKGACKDCSECMSEFGLMQEENADILFNRAYIGASGAEYEAFLAEEEARGAFRPDVHQLGWTQETYDATHPEPIKVGMIADTSEIDAQLEELQTTAEELASKPIDAITDTAMAKVEALHAAASAPATKIVTVIEQMVGSSGTSTQGVAGRAQQAAGSGWLEGLQSGGIVTRPGVFALAENSRPEAVLPLDNLKSIMGGWAKTEVNIYSPIYIEGGSSGGDELEAILKVRNEEIVEQIKQEIVRAKLSGYA